MNERLQIMRPYQLNRMNLGSYKPYIMHKKRSCCICYHQLKSNHPIKDRRAFTTKLAIFFLSKDKVTGEMDENIIYIQLSLFSILVL